MKDYNLYSNIDNYSLGRGVSIYVHKSLKSTESKFHFNKDYLESVWTEIKLSASDTLLCGVIYKSQRVKENDLLDDLFLSVCNDKRYTHLLIMGDFNYPQIDWLNWTSSECSDHPSTKFIETRRDSFLFQHILTPTRFRQNQQPNTLDLIFTNEEQFIQQAEVSHSLGLSDHSLISFDFVSKYEVYAESVDPCQNYFIFDRGDYPSIAKELSAVNWSNEFKGLTVDEMITFLDYKLSGLMDRYIPRRTHKIFTTGSVKNNLPIWMNRKTFVQIKKKHNAYKRWIQSSTGTNYIKYRQQCNKVKAMTRKSIKVFEKSITDKIRSNPKSFWKYANSKRKCKIKIGDLTADNGSIIDSDENKVDLLNSFFTSVFTKEDLSNMPTFHDRIKQKESFLTNIDFSKEDVKKILHSLDISKSPGPDNFHPRILKELSNELSEPLFLLFSKSLIDGVLPKIWKDAHVTPVYKKGEKCSPGNYRPISLASVICKTLEKLIRNAIVDHMEKNSLFNKSQHGFLKTRSCMTPNF